MTSIFNDPSRWRDYDSNTPPAQWNADTGVLEFVGSSHGGLNYIGDQDYGSTIEVPYTVENASTGTGDIEVNFYFGTYPNTAQFTATIPNVVGSGTITVAVPLIGGFYGLLDSIYIAAVSYYYANLILGEIPDPPPAPDPYAHNLLNDSDRWSPEGFWNGTAYDVVTTTPDPESLTYSGTTAEGTSAIAFTYAAIVGDFSEQPSLDIKVNGLVVFSGTLAVDGDSDGAIESPFRYDQIPGGATVELVIGGTSEAFYGFEVVLTPVADAVAPSSFWTDLTRVQLDSGVGQVFKATPNVYHPAVPAQVYQAPVHDCPPPAPPPGPPEPCMTLLYTRYYTYRNNFTGRNLTLAGTLEGQQVFPYDMNIPGKYTFLSAVTISGLEVPC